MKTSPEEDEDNEKEEEEDKDEEFYRGEGEACMMETWTRMRPGGG